MKKIILWIFILSVFYSCSSIEHGDTKISIENNIETPQISWAQEQEKKIEWDENIEFTLCDSIGNYENESLFQETQEVQFLLDKLKWSGYLSSYNNIWEYCVNSKKDKYIVWAYNDYRETTIIPFRYDKSIDLVEISDLRSLIFYTLTKWEYVPDRNYGNNQLWEYLQSYVKEKKSITWFGKKQWNIIPFVNYGVGVNGVQESWWAVPITSLSRIIKNKKNTNYCQSGLTLEWNLAICFVDIYYSYDVIENIIREDKICSYYIDDDGKIKILESCYHTGDDYKDVKFPSQKTKKYEDDRRVISTKWAWIK